MACGCLNCFAALYIRVLEFELCRVCQNVPSSSGCAYVCLNCLRFVQQCCSFSQINLQILNLLHSFGVGNEKSQFRESGKTPASGRGSGCFFRYKTKQAFLYSVWQMLPKVHLTKYQFVVSLWSFPIYHWKKSAKNTTIVASSKKRTWQQPCSVSEKQSMTSLVPNMANMATDDKASSATCCFGKP